ncbi:MAG: DUF2721 domain-containing protein [Leptospirales bacterium]|nr:DUF2721 domain-containing protein [Leptospirales bacterium]
MDFPLLSDVTNIIHIAVAPVFLLTAIATMINSMNTRMARIIDRHRLVKGRLAAAAEAEREELQFEVRHLKRRTRLIYYAIFCFVLSALLVCVVVGGAFVAALLGFALARMVAITFIAGMASMVAGLGLFLREVFLAVSVENHFRS